MKKCEICSLGIGEEKKLATGDYNEMYFKHRDKLDYVICALGDGWVTYKVRYCPNCGRRVGE